MKTLRYAIAIMFCIATMANQDVLAQGNSGNAKEKQHTVKQDKEQGKTKKEVKKTEIEALERDMKNASPEQKQKIKKRIDDLEEDKGYRKDRSDDGLDHHEHMEDHPGKGNAYGKYKEGLSGREFGQARAADARNKVKYERDVIREREIFLEQSERRILSARERLEEARRQKQISDEDARKKQEIIVTAENRAAELKRVIAEAKKKMETQERRLDRIYVEQE